MYIYFSINVTVPCTPGLQGSSRKNKVALLECVNPELIYMIRSYNKDWIASCAPDCVKRQLLRNIARRAKN